VLFCYNSRYWYGADDSIVKVQPNVMIEIAPAFH
jgi:hypothetical protein